MDEFNLAVTGLGPYPEAEKTALGLMEEAEGAFCVLVADRKRKPVGEREVCYIVADPAEGSRIYLGSPSSLSYITIRTMWFKVVLHRGYVLSGCDPWEPHPAFMGWRIR